VRGVRVKPIDYEVLPRAKASLIGLRPEHVEQHLGDLSEMAVLRCVDDRGEKLTAVGHPGQLREVLASGEDGVRQGVTLDQPRWPVVLRGWLQAS
jgi:hypothetical protein